MFDVREALFPFAYCASDLVHPAQRCIPAAACGLS